MSRKKKEQPVQIVCDYLTLEDKMTTLVLRAGEKGRNKARTEHRFPLGEDFERGDFKSSCVERVSAQLTEHYYPKRSEGIVFLGHYRAMMTKHAKQLREMNADIATIAKQAYVLSDAAAEMLDQDPALICAFRLTESVRHILNHFAK